MDFIRQKPQQDLAARHGFSQYGRGAFGSATGLLIAAVCLFGCASPGPPRPPSLNLPQPVTDLTASRTGNLVELRFTVPALSTDKLPLYEPHRRHITLRGLICREVPPSSCKIVTTIQPPLTATGHTVFTWHEELPPELIGGPPRLLSYRVEFLSNSNKSAGKSVPAFTAAGAAPDPVTNLRATGTRAGTLLQWASSVSASDILLHRVDLAPQPRTPKPPTQAKGSFIPKANVDDLWLNANSTESRTLDPTVTAGIPYRYTAERRIALKLDGHAIELRSEPSAPIELRSEPSAPIDFTLQPIYPPAVPAGLDATGFTPPDGSHFAVDLIWQPVSDAGITPALAAPLTGYNVYREQLDAAGNTTAPRTRLTATPTAQPSFHDPTADPAARYRYSVTSIDSNGNESRAAVFLLGPSLQ